MNSSLNFILLILGIVEIIFAINAEKLARSKYASEKIRDLNGLIKWEKITTILIGISIIIFSIIGFKGGYNTYGNYFIFVILALMIITYAGKRRYK